MTVPGIPHHVIQRGNNRQACFYCDEDYLTYLEWLKEYAQEFDCEVHAYVLMTNHVHLLVTPSTITSLSSFMKALSQRYVQYINRTYKRSGSFWEGRYKSSVTSEDHYVLACYRYIELNPVRASMVEHPAEYRWSSYRVNAQGEASDIISPHPTYLALADDSIRFEAYRDLFRYELDPGLVDELREATKGNLAFGSEKFKKQIEDAIGYSMEPRKIGRPSKET
tara:strand:+ start:16734 stop:17402 length:669 start_codon:yes stop_codon:yes gene_type:complete